MDRLSYGGASRQGVSQSKSCASPSCALVVEAKRLATFLGCLAVMRSFSGAFALAALLQLGISAAIQPARARDAGLDLPTIGTYADSEAEEQITSASQFSDLRPDSWAYQALTNLVSRYGCVAGYPNGTFQGGAADHPLRSRRPSCQLPGSGQRGDR
jgi:hypothetical protein